MHLPRNVFDIYDLDEEFMALSYDTPVSYTHLDVYKRQAVEGAHKTEQRAEDVYHYMKYHRKSKAQRKRCLLYTSL